MVFENIPEGNKIIRAIQSPEGYDDHFWLILLEDTNKGRSFWIYNEMTDEGFVKGIHYGNNPPEEIRNIMFMTNVLMYKLMRPRT